ncbi:hypothetical protein IJ096_03155, partial [Candidatus Saccharibacteria bacterium]|nr:hypothetical protein [Candidatus Saccharibacteria bacterium]
MQKFKQLPKPLLILIGVVFVALVVILIFSLTHSQTTDPAATNPTSDTVGTLPEVTESKEEPEQPTESAKTSAITPNKYNSSNCTTAWGALTLINPNFTVDTSYIAQRQKELINLTATYNITES